MRFSPYRWSKADIVGGAPALDFVNTASAWASGDPVDRLGGAEGLVDWAVVAGLVAPADAESVRADLANDPQSGAATFDEAIGLRALLWRVFDAAAHGRRVATNDLQALRDWTCRARAAQRIEQTESGFRECCREGARPLETILHTAALSAERLLMEGPLDRLHACGGADCEWMFLDLSKNGSRRWCSMATCGNSAKVKNFRTRKTGAVSKGP